jgi:hypothetical protein
MYPAVNAVSPKSNWQLEFGQPALSAMDGAQVWVAMVDIV